MNAKVYGAWRKKIGNETLERLRGTWFTHKIFLHEFTRVEKEYGVRVETDTKYLGNGLVEGGHAFTSYPERAFKFLGQKVKKGILKKEKKEGTWHYDWV
jgi:hypothetical protein